MKPKLLASILIAAAVSITSLYVMFWLEEFYSDYWWTAPTLVLTFFVCLFSAVYTAARLGIYVEERL